MFNVFKVRIYPNQQQEIALNKNLGCARFVWNYYLNKTNSQYQATGKGMTYCQMAKDLTQLKKNTDYEWLAESTAATLQQALKNKGLKLPKLGIVKAKISKKIVGKIKSVTVSKTSTGKYFASILFEADNLIINKNELVSGIDLGLSSKRDSF